MFVSETGRFIETEGTLSSHAYRGISVGSERTCHQFSGFDLAFDTGGAPMFATVVPNFFVTHGHNDHVGGIASLAYRRKGWGLAPPVVYMAEALIPRVQGIMRAVAGAAGGYPPPVEFKVAEAGEAIPWSHGDQIMPFRADHRIPTLGYAILRTRKRLKPEFRDKPREDLIAAKNAGIEINESVTLPEVVFCGDTTIRVMDGKYPCTARLLLLECTGLDDTIGPGACRKTGHIHLDDVVKAAHDGAFAANETVLLTHFSARYSIREIREHTKILSDVPDGHKFRLLIPGLPGVGG